jgi:hypothetical protein
VKAGADGSVLAGTDAMTCDAAGLRVRWRGFAYVRGHASGAPSIARFAARAARHGPAAAAAELRGLYFALVEDRARQETYAFVDPSGYFHAFWSADGADDDFLALARAGGRGADDLDPEAVAELVTQGQIAFGRTAFASIRRIEAGQVVVLPWSGASPRHVPKPLPGLDEPPALGLLEQLEQLVPSLAGHRISLDLTGGLDSRLLAVALARLDVEFETATTGRPGSADVRLGREVAARLGRDHVIVEHRPQELAAELEGLLTGSGCLVNPLVSQRELQLQRVRAERGVDLVIHGLGGESFKDFFWQQDFPRYWGAHADLERLWRMRIERPQTRAAPLAGEYAVAAGRIPLRYIERMGAYRMPRKTQTYDRIFFEVRSRDVNGRALTLRSQVIPTFAPLVDLDVQRLAFCLPRRSRVFNGFHRRTLTGLDPGIARVATTDGGMTASSAPAVIPLDAGRWVTSKAWRLAKKAAPARWRPLPPESPLPPLLRILRALPQLEAGVERLRLAEILRGDVTVDDLADGHLGGIMALARLLEELERR